MQIGGIILCGGRSTRMGSDKATLPFGPELILQRIVRLLSEAIQPQDLVVVAATHQVLPGLPPEITITRDQHPGRGPLEGLAAGLAALPPTVEAAYLTGCDAPLLVPAFVNRMFELLADHDIAVPRNAGQVHPLSGVYRRSVLPGVEQLLNEDRRRLQLLFEKARTRFVPFSELQTIDPELQSLINLNHPDDYTTALHLAGLAHAP